MCIKFAVTVCALLLAVPSFAKQTATVVSVTDGDTLVVMLNGRKEKVRLIGIDAPESRKNRKAYRDTDRSGNDVSVLIIQGKRATAFVRDIVKKGHTVRLELDAEHRDRYGRLLAYVYLSDGRMLNDLIVRSGYASPMTIPPNVRYKDRFLESYQYARKNSLGLWAEK